MNLRRFLLRNWGAPFVGGFIVLLLIAAADLDMGLASTANEIATTAFYLLIIGVGLQAASLAKFGEDRGVESPLAEQSKSFTGKVRLSRKTAVVIVAVILTVSSVAAIVSYRPSVPLCTFGTSSSGSGNNIGSTTTATNYALTNGLVGYWSYAQNVSGGETTVPDLSGNGNDGRLVNGATHEGGRTFGGFFSFNGTHSQYLDLTSQNGFPMGDHPRSFFACVKTTDSVDTQVLFSYGTAVPAELIVLDLNQAVPGSLYFASINNDCYILSSNIFGTNIEDGNWHLVGFTYSGNSSLVLYVDGQGAACTLPGILHTTPSHMAHIASSYGLGNPNYFNGQLFDARLYNRSLNSKEVSVIYSARA